MHLSRLSRTIARSIAAAAVVVIGVDAMGSGVAAEPPSDVPTLIVYDVRDLVHPVPDQKPPAAFALRMRASDAAPQTTETLMASLLEQFRSIGGEDLRIETVDGNVLLRATEGTHDAIQDHLAEARANRSLQVDLQATFISTERPLVTDLHFVKRGNDRTGDYAVATVPAKFADAFLKRARDREQATVLSAPRLLVNDGQTALISVTSAASVELPRTDAPDLAPAPVDLPHGTILMIKPTVDDDRAGISIRANPRTVFVDADADPTVERDAQAVINESMPLDRVLIIRLDEMQWTIAGAAANRDLEVVPQRHFEGRTGRAVYVVLRPALIIPQVGP